MTTSPIETIVMSINDPAALPAAVAFVKAGQIVAFPTDTVYGVACDLWQEQAIARLYEAKLRPTSLPMPVLVARSSDVLLVASCLPAGFDALVATFWPGALTVIVPKRNSVPAMLTAGGDTVAVRLPDHPWARAFIAAAGGALAVTSANISGSPALTDAEGVRASLEGRVRLIVDGGVCTGGVASTIVDLVTSPPRVLRLGALPYADLQRTVPCLAPPASP